ncbi:MAG: hypothetical protein IJY67_10955 [Paludibacteraceae bacterium]|nr:hypothetical protein [Paludibacteraceae bacterium]
MKRLTHDEFINKLSCKNQYFINGALEIIGQYVNRRTQIQCKCNIHNYIWNEFPEKLYSGHSCPECDGRQFSDIKIFGDKPNLWTTRPDIAQLLKNPEDGYRCTYGTIKKFEFICPVCGNVILKPVFQVSHHGLCCKKCSDGVSLPNKYSRALLDQLPINDYTCEYQPDWAKPYFYDNYFEYNGNKYILEMDGAYHYVEKSVSKKSLEERQKDDQIKDDLAVKNGVDVIRINCAISQADFIKENILESKLSDIFDLSSINWELCDEKSQKNLVKYACELYMQHLYTLVEIEQLLHISKDTLRRYLKTGVRFGWCDYNPETRKTYPKPILVFDSDNNLIHRFYGIRDTARQMKAMYDINIDRHEMVEACKVNKQYKGFYFRLQDDNTK